MKVDLIGAGIFTFLSLAMMVCAYYLRGIPILAATCLFVSYLDIMSVRQAFRNYYQSRIDVTEL